MLLKQYRKAHALTLADVAKATGYSISAISKYENEKASMPDDFINLIRMLYDSDMTRQVSSYEKDILSSQRVEVLEYALDVHNQISMMSYDEYKALKVHLNKLLGKEVK